MKHFCIIYRNVDDGGRRMVGVRAAKTIAAGLRRKNEIVETIY